MTHLSLGSYLGLELWQLHRGSTESTPKKWQAMTVGDSMFRNSLHARVFLSEDFIKKEGSRRIFGSGSF